jgi:glycosyltransferase involved in cell wall biosynthesis
MNREVHVRFRESLEGWFLRATRPHYYEPVEGLLSGPQIVLEPTSPFMISADNPCLPELFGDAAVDYPPKDGKALSKAILKVLSRSDDKRREVSDLAKQRASQFSWDVCAEKTVSELAQAAESRQSGKL